MFFGGGVGGGSQGVDFVHGVRGDGNEDPDTDGHENHDNDETLCVVFFFHHYNLVSLHDSGDD